MDKLELSLGILSLSAQGYGAIAAAVIVAGMVAAMYGRAHGKRSK